MINSLFKWKKLEIQFEHIERQKVPNIGGLEPKTFCNQQAD